MDFNQGDVHKIFFCHEVALNKNYKKFVQGVIELTAFNQNRNLSNFIQLFIESKKSRMGAVHKILLCLAFAYRNHR